VEGWDDYVRFSAERPRLYAAMMARVLRGAAIPAVVAGLRDRDLTHYYCDPDPYHFPSIAHINGDRT
jgi:hypothetical protein